MTVTETILVFVCIPLAVVGLVYALVYGSSSGSRGKRYRPGREFNSAPVWFLADPEPGATAPVHHELAASGGVTHIGEVGGASDTW